MPSYYAAAYDSEVYFPYLYNDLFFTGWRFLVTLKRFRSLDARSGTGGKARGLSRSTSSRISDAQPKIFLPATTRRIACIRRRRSSRDISMLCSIAAAKPSTSYGLIMEASCNCCAAPAISLSINTPSSSSRAATNSFATRFIPSCNELTIQKFASR